MSAVLRALQEFSGDFSIVEAAVRAAYTIAAPAGMAG
jgi:hypothetical protein